ncbi:hypothetical protein ERO13_D10G060050v2, partial [Gossypium hirsutum]
VFANKICVHTIISIISNERFGVYSLYKEAKEIWDSVITGYTTKHLEMIEDKDIKVQINESHKLLEDFKS